MSTATTEQIVAIQSVDPTGQTAIGLTRQQTLLQIDTRYHAGAVHVTPSEGEQWYVKRRGTCWVLEQKLPFNTEVLLAVADNPVQGQVQIGSSGYKPGPLLLHGTLIQANAPLRYQTTDSTTRPDPTALPAGSTIWDTGLKKPITTDGAAWYDASGSAV
jgi:hypothetical protein